MWGVQLATSSSNVKSRKLNSFIHTQNISPNLEWQISHCTVGSKITRIAFSISGVAVCFLYLLLSLEAVYMLTTAISLAQCQHSPIWVSLVVGPGDAGGVPPGEPTGELGGDDVTERGGDMEVSVLGVASPVWSTEEPSGTSAAAAPPYQPLQPGNHRWKMPSCWGSGTEDSEGVGGLEVSWLRNSSWSWMIQQITRISEFLVSYQSLHWEHKVKQPGLLNALLVTSPYTQNTKSNSQDWWMPC